MSGKIRLSSPGIKAAALNSPQVRAAVAARADRMAASLHGIESHEGPVDIVRDAYTSDRAVEGVTLAHASGIALEAEYGFLTEAAAAAGLTLGRRK